MSFKKNMKKNVIRMVDRSGETAIEVRRGMKSVWLSRKIQQELEDGIPLEDVIFARVPTLDSQLVREDAQALLDGIQSLYDAMQHDIDAAWVEQQLNKALSNLTIEKRVAYLSNAVTAVTTAYPDVTLDEEEAAILERTGSTEEHTAADVDDLLSIMGSVLPQFGELLQRSSTAAMLARLHKMDHVEVEDHANFGMNAVVAYAAACYVMQRCGETVTINGRADGDMSAYALGAAAAASVESSKLMELYSAGKISMGTFAGRLKNMFTAAAAYTFGSVIQFLSVAAYAVTITAAAELFTAIFLMLGAYLYFSPIWIIGGAFTLSALLVTSAVSIADYEEALQGMWDLLKSLWSKIKGLWNDLTVVDEDEDVVEIEVEDVSEAADLDEEEEDSEEDCIDPDGTFA